MGETIPDSERKGKVWVRSVLHNRDLFPAVLLVIVGVVSFGLGRLSVEPSLVGSPKGLLSSVSNTEGSSRRLPDDTGAGESAGEQTGEQTEGRQSNTEAASSALAAGTTDTNIEASPEKKYVGSKNSNKYHLPWCSGAARIAEENKVWFSSKEEAAAAGYTPAGNCKGI